MTLQNIQHTLTGLSNMEIKTTGKYVLLADKAFRSSFSAFTVLAGTIINVTQIDYKNDKFYSNELGDWQYWEQPMEYLDEKENERLSEVYKLK